MEAIATKLLGEFGMLPMLALMAVILWFFLREVKKEVKGVNTELCSFKESLGESLKVLKEDLLKKIKELEDKSDAQDAKIVCEISEIKEHVKYIEREYVRRDDHYKDLGGWRTDFKDLSDRIDKIYDGMILAGSVKTKEK